MIGPAAPAPTDKPDLAPLIRQGNLEDVLCDILAATFDSQNTVTHEGEDGKDYSLVVDKTGRGPIEITLYRHDHLHWDGAEVAQVRLDYIVMPTEQVKS